MKKGYSFQQMVWKTGNSHLKKMNPDIDLTPVTKPTQNETQT